MAPVEAVAVAHVPGHRGEILAHDLAANANGLVVQPGLNRCGACRFAEGHSPETRQDEDVGIDEVGQSNAKRLEGEAKQVSVTVEGEAAGGCDLAQAGLVVAMAMQSNAYEG